MTKSTEHRLIKEAQAENHERRLEAVKRILKKIITATNECERSIQENKAVQKAVAGLSAKLVIACDKDDFLELDRLQDEINDII